MGVIKSANAPLAAAPFSMRDIEAQAQAIIQRARQQADQILADVRSQAQAIRQNAYDAGFTAGREDGLRKGTEDGLAAGRQQALAEHRQSLRQLAQTLTAVVKEIDESRCRLESQAASEVVKLAVAIARRVTKLQGSLDDRVLTENVRAAMKLVVRSTDVRIAVHPSQKQVLTQVLPLLQVDWPAISHVEIVADDALSPGGCRVFTAQGKIDADLDAQIDRVAADLLPGGGQSQS